MDKNELYVLRKKKIKDEIRAARRIIKKRVEPLKIADKFIHDSFELMKDRIVKNNPEIKDERLRERVHEILDITRKIKSKRKRGRKIGRN
ncbi:MAG: hypothetical protein R6U96_08115 [Promethearchaeia archaeon]